MNLYINSDNMSKVRTKTMPYHTTEENCKDYFSETLITSKQPMLYPPTKVY